MQDIIRLSKPASKPHHLSYFLLHPVFTVAVFAETQGQHAAGVLLSLFQSPQCHPHNLEVKVLLLLPLPPEASAAGTSFPAAHTVGALGFTLTHGCQTAAS